MWNVAMWVRLQNSITLITRLQTGPRENMKKSIRNLENFKPNESNQISIMALCEVFLLYATFKVLPQLN